MNSEVGGMDKRTRLPVASRNPRQSPRCRTDERLSKRNDIPVDFACNYGRHATKLSLPRPWGRSPVGELDSFNAHGENPCQKCHN